MTTSRPPARAGNATPPSVDPARSALSGCRAGDPRALQPNQARRYRPPQRSALRPSCACGRTRDPPRWPKVRPEYLRDVDEQVYLPKAVRGLLYVGQDDPELLFG